jgi:hypothetical protein
MEATAHETFAPSAFTNQDISYKSKDTASTDKVGMLLCGDRLPEKPSGGGSYGEVVSPRRGSVLGEGVTPLISPLPVPVAAATLPAKRRLDNTQSNGPIHFLALHDTGAAAAASCCSYMAWLYQLAVSAPLQDGMSRLQATSRAVERLRLVDSGRRSRISQHTILMSTVAATVVGACRTGLQPYECVEMAALWQFLSAAAAAGQQAGNNRIDRMIGLALAELKDGRTDRRPWLRALAALARDAVAKLLYPG